MGNRIREMTTVSTSFFSVSAPVIQIRLLYGYGNANENRSFFHYGNKLVPSLLGTLPRGMSFCPLKDLTCCVNWILITDRQADLFGPLLWRRESNECWTIVKLGSVTIVHSRGKRFTKGLHDRLIFVPLSQRNSQRPFHCS